MMGTYRIEWPCCGDVTETEAWEPEHCPFCTPNKPEIATPAGHDMRDAYVGAREDLAIWKRRALAAEKDTRRLDCLLNDFWFGGASEERREAIKQCLDESEVIAFLDAELAANPSAQVQSPAVGANDALDAARWRWLREENQRVPGPCAYAPWAGPPMFGDELDAAVDAAMASHPPVHSTGGE